MISVVVLTHNDAAYIERTLKSVVWCDELIVIDDESADNTKELSKKYDATVYSRALNNDFASQRNFGVSKAKGEWVLFVDSDEVVPEPLKKDIIQIVRDENGNTNGNSGYYIKRTDYMWGTPLLHGETADVRLLRLARKGSGQWVRPVHEVWDIQGTTSLLPSPLFHYPHPTVAQFIHDVNTYTTINADMLYREHTPAPGWHIVAYPFLKFIRNYVWHLGFLDGMPGLCMAMIMSFHSFLNRAKLYMHYHKQPVPLP